MKFIKKIIVGAATVTLASGLYAVPAMAATATNANISGNSFADVSAYDNDDVLVKTNNEHQFLLNVDASAATTGFNFQSGGEDQNSLTASNASAAYQTDNFLNNNEAMGNEDGALASNASVSDHSDGDADATSETKVRITNVNEYTGLINLTASVANTGFNSQNDNEDGNSLMAGWAASEALTSNVVNHNIVVGGDGASAVAKNTGITGTSFADAQANNTNDFSVTNRNENTIVGNATVALSNSGLNTQNGNEDGNTMTTGNTVASSVASNYVNVNETQVGGGSAVATNSSISDHSDGDAQANSTTTVKVANTNSETAVVNVSAAVSNSGGNTQNDNEDGNTMTTGSAVAVGQTTNVVNANQVCW